MQRRNMYSPGFVVSLTYKLENKPEYRYWLFEIQIGHTLWTNRRKGY